MMGKMRDDREKDDLDRESLADKNAVAEERLLSPDKVLEQEELSPKKRIPLKCLFLVLWMRKQRKRLFKTKWKVSLLRLRRNKRRRVGEVSL